MSISISLGCKSVAPAATAYSQIFSRTGLKNPSINVNRKIYSREVACPRQIIKFIHVHRTVDDVRLEEPIRFITRSLANDHLSDMFPLYGVEKRIVCPTALVDRLPDKCL